MFLIHSFDRIFVVDSVSGFDVIVMKPLFIGSFDALCFVQHHSLTQAGPVSSGHKPSLSEPKIFLLRMFGNKCYQL